MDFELLVIVLRVLLNLFLLLLTSLAFLSEEGSALWDFLRGWERSIIAIASKPLSSGVTRIRGYS